VVSATCEEPHTDTCAAIKKGKRTNPGGNPCYQAGIQAAYHPEPGSVLRKDNVCAGKAIIVFNLCYSGNFFKGPMNLEPGAAPWLLPPRPGKIILAPAQGDCQPVRVPRERLALSRYRVRWASMTDIEAPHFAYMPPCHTRFRMSFTQVLISTRHTLCKQRKRSAGLSLPTRVCIWRCWIAAPHVRIFSLTTSRIQKMMRYPATMTHWLQAREQRCWGRA